MRQNLYPQSTNILFSLQNAHFGQSLCRSHLARRRRRHRRKREKKRRRLSLEAVNRRLQRLRRNHLWSSDRLPATRGMRAKRLRSWPQAIRATKFAHGRTSEYMTSKNKRNVDDINTNRTKCYSLNPLDLGSPALYHFFWHIT